MAHAMTAENLYQDLKKLHAAERQKFFVILSENAFHGDDLNHEQLFGHLANEAFTAQESAQYLEVSMSTFRRFVANKKLSASSSVGRNQMFMVPELKAFKRAMQITKA